MMLQISSRQLEIYLFINLFTYSFTYLFIDHPQLQLRFPHITHLLNHSEIQTVQSHWCCMATLSASLSPAIKKNTLCRATLRVHCHWIFKPRTLKVLWNQLDGISGATKKGHLLPAQIVAGRASKLENFRTHFQFQNLRQVALPLESGEETE